eukprot:328059-Pleurochrysis_carterae.AAC.1
MASRNQEYQKAVTETSLCTFEKRARLRARYVPRVDKCESEREDARKAQARRHHESRRARAQSEAPQPASARSRLLG